MKTSLTLFILIFVNLTNLLAIQKSLNAGPDQTISAGQVAHLNGTSVKYKHYFWTTKSTGTFTDPTSLYSDYIPSKADIRRGKVILTLRHQKDAGIFDSMTLYINSCYTVSLNSDIDRICGYEGTGYDLSANTTGSGYLVHWTASGSGSFNNDSTLSSTYLFSGADLTAGSVFLKVTLSDPGNDCPVVSDSLKLIIKEPAHINLPDEEISVCGDEPVHFNGNISGSATTVYWTTSGSGYFSQNEGAETFYFPSAEDRMNGYVSIGGKTNDPAGICGAALDVAGIRFGEIFIDAGPDITECGYEWGGEFYLNVTNSGASDIYWSTDGSGYFSDPYAANPGYSYTDSDVNNAFINLYVTGSRPGCIPVTDTVKVWLQAAPKLEFPEPNVYQSGNEPVSATVYLYGHASSGTWTTSGSGYFSDPNSTFSPYYPSAEEKRNGCVELFFTSNDPEGPCGAASGSMSACFNSNCPSLDLGPDLTECGYPSGGMVNVNATVSDYEYIEWSANGAGGFSDPYSASTYYYYDPSDVNAAFIELYATAYSLNGCSASDAVVIWLQAAPDLVFPEQSISACANTPVNATVYLYGHASSGTWTSNGSGTFGDPDSPYTSYYPGAGDAGMCVDLIFNSNDPDGPCGATSGYMTACFTECSWERTAENSQYNSEVSTQLFPNPATDIMEVKTDLITDPARSYFTDMTGNKVNLNWNSRTSIDVSALNTGMYLLHLVFEDGSKKVLKFEKQ